MEKDLGGVRDKKVDVLPQAWVQGCSQSQKIAALCMELNTDRSG